MAMTKAEQLVMEAKISLLREFPFMSFMVMSCRHIETDIVPTMGATIIGGTPTVFFNPEFTCDRLQNEAERAFVIAHELLHIYFQHLGRQRDHGYNHKLWNIATDYCINYYLVDIKSKKLEFPSKFQGLYDEKYAGLSSDEIYHQLLQEAKDNLDDLLDQYGDPNDEDGDGNGSGSGEGQGSGKKKGKGKKGSPFDEVSAEDLSADDKAQLKAQLAASLNAAANSTKDMGTGAGNLFRKLMELVEPKVDWKQVLRDFVTTTSKYRYTFNKYNRRSTNIVFPSLTGDFINVAFGIDTSGSMSEEDLSEMLTELKGILNDFEAWTVTLMSCDTDAHLIGHYSSENGDDFASIDMKLIGGGGTDMQPMIDMADNLETIVGENPNVIIIGTDGYIPAVKGSDTIATMFLVTRNGQKEFEHTHVERVIQVN